MYLRAEVYFTFQEHIKKRLLKIMTRRTAATASKPLWNSLGSAVRQTIRSLSAPSAALSAFEELEGEQTRIRQSSRLWLVG